MESATLAAAHGRVGSGSEDFTFENDLLAKKLKFEIWCT